MYPYQLGYHLKTKQLCRIPLDHIPVGTVKIIRYKPIYRGEIGHLWVNPYYKDGELDDRYWSIVRAQDIEYRLRIENEIRLA